MAFGTDYRKSAIDGAITGGVVLLHAPDPSVSYSFASAITRKGAKCAFFSMDLPLPQARQQLVRHKADLGMLNLADAASIRAGVPLEHAENIAYAFSPREFEEVSLAIDACTNGLEGGGVLMLDSLSIMFLYNDPRMVAKFAAAMSSKLREKRVGMVMAVGGKHPDVHADLVSMADAAVGFD